MNDGIKVSKFYSKDQKLVCHYCDVVEIARPDEHSYIFIDLLVDVVVQADGFVKIIDLDELAEALGKRLVTEAQTSGALIKCDKLLKIIYNGGFGQYIQRFDTIIRGG